MALIYRDSSGVHATAAAGAAHAGTASSNTRRRVPAVNTGQGHNCPSQGCDSKGHQSEGLLLAHIRRKHDPLTWDLLAQQGLLPDGTVRCRHCNAPLLISPKRHESSCRSNPERVPAKRATALSAAAMAAPTSAAFTSPSRPAESITQSIVRATSTPIRRGLTSGGLIQHSSPSVSAARDDRSYAAVFNGAPRRTMSTGIPTPIHAIGSRNTPINIDLPTLGVLTESGTMIIHRPLPATRVEAKTTPSVASTAATPSLASVRIPMTPVVEDLIAAVHIDPDGDFNNANIADHLLLLGDDTPRPLRSRPASSHESRLVQTSEVLHSSQAPLIRDPPIDSVPPPATVPSAPVGPSALQSSETTPSCTTLLHQTEEVLRIAARLDNYEAEADIMHRRALEYKSVMRSTQINLLSDDGVIISPRSAAERADSKRSAPRSAQSEEHKAPVLQHGGAASSAATPAMHTPVALAAIAASAPRARELAAAAPNNPPPVIPEGAGPDSTDEIPAELYQSPSEMAQHGRLLRKCPAEFVLRFIEFAEPFFARYTAASQLRDNNLMFAAMLEILAIPRAMLSRKHGGRKHVAISDAEFVRRLARDTSEDNGTGVRLADIRHHGRVRDQQENRSLRRIILAQALLHAGHVGKAAAKLASADMADTNDPIVHDELTRLHPECSSALPHPPMPAEAPRAIPANDELISFIRRRAKGSAPGPSGWTYDLLAQIVGNANIRTAIGLIMMDLENGRMPHALKPYMLGCTIVALIKRANAAMRGNLRPIAIGETFWRLATAHTLAHHEDTTRTHLAPYQFGIGVPGGVERIIHAVNATLTDPDIRHAAVTIDFANAFNALDRGAMLTELYSHREFRGIFAIADWGYTSDTPLHFLTGRARSDGLPQELLTSRNGVRQGDPLGSLLFCIAIHRIMRECMEGHPGARLYAFLDNITITGAPDVLPRIIDDLTARAAVMGLDTVPAKSEWLWYHNEPLPDHAEQHRQRRGFILNTDVTKLLGCPIGRDTERIAAMADGIARKYDPMFRLLDHQKFTDQQSMLLLRMCLVPTYQFLVRVLPPHLAQRGAKTFDDMVLRTAYARTHFAHSEGATRSLFTPIRAAGVGLRSATRTAPFAYYSSIAAALPTIMARPTAEGKGAAPGDDIERCIPRHMFQHVAACRDVMYVETPDADYSKLLPARIDRASFIQHFGTDPTRAKSLQSALTVTKFASYLDAHLVTAVATNPLEAVRLSAVTAPHATAWLTGTPINGESSLNNHDFTAALALHSHQTLPGMVPFLNRTCPNCEGHGRRSLRTTLADDPFHSLSCSGGGHTSNRILRHDNIYRIMADAVHANGGVVTVEPRGVSHDDERRPDLEIVMGHRRIFVDVTVTHPSTPARAGHGARMARMTADQAIQNMVRVKTNQHANYCNALGAEFIAVVFTTYGSMNAEAQQLLNDIGHFDGGVLFPLCSRWSAARLFVAVSCTLQRGNAGVLNAGVHSLYTGIVTSIRRNERGIHQRRARGRGRGRGGAAAPPGL